MRSSNAAVVSMNSTDYDNNEQWDAIVLLRKLEKLRINKKIEDLMEPTQLLIHWILKKFYSYVSQDRNTHSEHSLCANPFLASHAVKILVFTNYYSQTDIDSMCDNFVSDMVENFSGMISSIAAGIQKQLKPSASKSKLTKVHLVLCWMPKMMMRMLMSWTSLTSSTRKNKRKRNNWPR